MSKLTKYICQCCCGRVNRVSLTCEYCGTAYKEEHDTLYKIEVYRNPVVTLASTVGLGETDLLMHPDDLPEYAVKRLAYELLDSLTQFMDIEYRFDPWDRVYRLDAKLKVVDPVHKPREAVSQLKEAIHGKSLS